jgi:poly(A) polymerase
MKFSSSNTSSELHSADGCVSIPRPEHCISRKNIDPNALKVMYRLKNCGFTAYLVGGAVRDLLLGREPKDFDVSTDARPRQIKKLFHNCFLIGRRFRLAHIRFPETIIETSTFRRQPKHDDRAEDPDAELYQHRDNCYGTPEEDVLRRDFTINALFYELKTFSVIDYVGGLEDLRSGVIRCIGDPDIRFREDPVRMLRAVRFAARMGFRIDPKTFNAIRVHYREIEKAAQARLLEEIYKLFAFRSGLEAFRLLYKTRLMEVLFPDLAKYVRSSGEQDSPLWRWLGALDGSMRVLEGPTPALIFSVLYAPLILSLYQERSEQGKKAIYADVVRDFLRPRLADMQVPRQISVRIEQILLGQLRFDPSKKRRFSKRGFVNQDSFPETLAFFEISTAVLDTDGDRLAAWKKLYSEEVLHREPAVPDVPPEEAGPEPEPEESDRPLAPWERFTRPAGTGKGKKRPTRNSRRKRKPARKATAGDGHEGSRNEKGAAESESGSEAEKKRPRRRRRRRPGRKKGSAGNGSASQNSEQ